MLRILEHKDHCKFNKNQWNFNITKIVGPGPGPGPTINDIKDWESAEIFIFLVSNF